MSSKLKIKIGPVEVEYEGEEKFLKEELPVLLKAVSALSQCNVLSSDFENEKQETPSKTQGHQNKQLSTSTIAGKLSCKTGADLIEAAAYHLVTVTGAGSFSRSDLIKEMRSAKSFFKKSYVSNLSNILKRLVNPGKRLNEVSSDTFSLPQTVIDELKGRLGS
jgi:hypothetical protein